MMDSKFIASCKVPNFCSVSTIKGDNEVRFSEFVLGGIIIFLYRNEKGFAIRQIIEV